MTPSKVGLLPYALVESTQRLTVALAEHRRWTDNPHIRTKCLVYAGLLAHYAQDAAQPLHLTIHYDGRALKNRTSPRKGIHLKIDALLGKLKVSDEEIIRDLPVKRFDNLFAAVLAQLRRSHAQVEAVYELEPKLPDLLAPIEAGGEVEAFARDRARVAVSFAASLFVTAWEDSAKIKFPKWHEREGEGPPPASTRDTTPQKQGVGRAAAISRSPARIAGAALVLPPSRTRLLDYFPTSPPSRGSISAPSTTFTSREAGVSLLK